MFTTRSISRRLAATGLATVALLGAAGLFGGSAYAGDDRRGTLPEHVFSPYFQAYTDANPATVSRDSGARYLTFAFLQTAQTGSCDVLWNGDPTKPVASSTFGAQIAQIRARGGDVVPSFGGYSADDTATEIADSCTDINKIAEQYEKVVETYNVTRLDMDVEDKSLDNLAGIDRRNKAIHLAQQWAQRHHRTLQVVFTIPTAPTGPEDNGINVFANAVQNHVDVTVVNIMTFDYYDNQAHEMADDTKTAANALVADLGKLYPHRSARELWQMVGVTEMVGIDDYGSGGETGPEEIFTLADAHVVTRWAEQHGLAELSFWALGRDNGGCPGTPGADNCSGVVQAPYQYTQIMRPFTDD
jgi:chitinase